MEITNAAALFGQIQSDGYEWIRRAVSEGAPEAPFLEFKQKASKSVRAIQKEDRRNFACEVSALANTEGGVVVWGVDCRAGEDDGPDVAQSEQPIRYYREFCSDLGHLTPTAVDPPVPGVMNVPIECPYGAGGFVVTYVPDSDLAPHRAMCQVNHYYIRTANNSVMMPHSILAAAFGKRRRPVLEITYSVEPGVIINHRMVQLLVNVSIANVGRHIALYPALDIMPNSPWTWQHSSTAFQRVAQTPVVEAVRGTRLIGPMMRWSSSPSFGPFRMASRL